MTVAQSLFGFKGRLKRLPWWIASILADFGTRHGCRDLRRAASVGVFSVAPRPASDLDLDCRSGQTVARPQPIGLLVADEFLPVIGLLWVLIECGFLRGTEGPNRFGDET
jgi:hypothetical protein